MAESLFEMGRRENYKRDFHRNRYNWGDDQEGSWYPSSRKFEFTDSTERSENDSGSVFRIPLSEISTENLKIISGKKYMLVQSNKKTIFIRINHRFRPESISAIIKGDMLIIGVIK